MEENKVVLKLQEYINLIKEVENLKHKLEEKNKNYSGMINHIKCEVKKDENYSIRNFDGNLEDSFEDKITNYYYKEILNNFLEKGITFDLALQLTNEIIKENLEKGEK